MKKIEEFKAEQAAMTPRMMILTMKRQKTEAEWTELNALIKRDDEIVAALSAAR